MFIRTLSTTILQIIYAFFQSYFHKYDRCRRHLSRMSLDMNGLSMKYSMLVGFSLSSLFHIFKILFQKCLARKYYPIEIFLWSHVWQSIYYSDGFPIVPWHRRWGHSFRYNYFRGEYFSNTQFCVVSFAAHFGGHNFLSETMLKQSFSCSKISVLLIFCIIVFFKFLSVFCVVVVVFQIEGGLHEPGPSQPSPNHGKAWEGKWKLGSSFITHGTCYFTV